MWGERETGGEREQGRAGEGKGKRKGIGITMIACTKPSLHVQQHIVLL